ncbi:protein translocase subunit SecF [Dialister pneumosintes]|jgi:protein-export membrane protein SecF|uniref:Protein-export membrane protein SecF n=1 Tax=Dialister pneumosintes TaxID=39950 RepID=A0A1B3WD35_9FIRM|nr:protein translocase subunit SecF [Dialister pneumosintes]AOH38886.1 protein-export membrane protein SecF [Dialister pneumosintes]RID94153.1 protein translocase subunit SecF [Dialister pneumosintes]CDF27153.1 protein translocase subunit SecF [Dialister sp. CAG:588]
MKRIDIVGHRKWWFSLSSLLVIIAFICIFMKGFNFGIDFTGGTILDLKFEQTVTVAQVREGLRKDNLENSVIQLSGDTFEESGKEVIIRTRSLTADEAQTIVSHISDSVGKTEINRIETVGAVIGSEVTKNTLLNVGLSFAVLVLYMSIRFEYRIAFSSILAILHDIIVVLGVFSFFQLEIDASFLAAILTVLGYSMNESVVIFDRIRESIRTHKRTDSFKILANDSIYQTIRRSFYTLSTVLFATGSLYFFGGETTKNFALVMLVGFISGAYSSICVATSLWVTWHEHASSRRNESLKSNKK